MRCGDCTNWITRRLKHYSGSGENIPTFDAPEGQGQCKASDRLEPADFGCVKFAPALSPLDHVETTVLDGEPWQHFHMIPCPDCAPNGGVGHKGHRCAGTGLVRLYDDGHIGDEQTRKHPKEIERERLNPPPPEDFSGRRLAPLPQKEDIVFTPLAPLP